MFTFSDRQRRSVVASHLYANRVLCYGCRGCTPSLREFIELIRLGLVVVDPPEPEAEEDEYLERMREIAEQNAGGEVGELA